MGERITYQNPENGHAVASLAPKRAGGAAGAARQAAMAAASL